MNKLWKLGLITHLILIISCSNGQTKSETENGNIVETIKQINTNASGQKQEYFQGVIGYSIEYNIKKPSISEEILKKHYGSKVIKKFSKGNFRDEYYNNEGVLVRTSILNLSQNQYYMELDGIDTIYYTDINITDFLTTIEQLADTNIQNIDCWAIKSISIDENNDRKTEPVITKYYKSKDLILDPDWYGNYIDGGYDRILKMAPGITIKSEYYNSNFTEIKRIVSIKAKEINALEFELESNKYMKNMN